MENKKQAGLMFLEDFSSVEHVLEQIEDWVVITDTEGIVLYLNAATEKISGYKRKELLGNKLSKIKSNVMPTEIYHNLWSNLLNEESFECVFANKHKDGHLYYIANSIYPIKGEDGKPHCFISLGKEMHEEYDLTKQIHETMHYDRLTGLLNRSSFVENLDQIKWAKHSVTVITIKIGRLGIINKQYGFGHGESSIKEASDRIQEILDKDIMFSRIDGNVFALSLIDCQNMHTIVSLIKRIEGLFYEPMDIKGQKIYISLAFGVATQNIHAERVDGSTLIANAQIALSQVKQINVIDKYEFYTAHMNEELQKRAEAENQIVQGNRNNEFVPFFQPIFDLKTGEVCSLEALVRWEKPSGELVGPGAFIKILEETGLIVEVGYSLIRQIAHFIKGCISAFGYCLPIAINLSPVQFKDKNFEERILAYFESEGIPSNLIIFEITESTFIEDIEFTTELLEKIHEKGFRVAIDDFGTGYSSLAYLQKLKVNTLKIDMSFIENIVKNEGDQVIVNAVIKMAKGLGLHTVAEGIETREQMEIVRTLGGDEGQGFYWDKPMSAQDILVYFEAGPGEACNKRVEM